jgi:transposase
MGRPSKLTDDQKLELADYALTVQRDGRHRVFWPSTPELCAYAQRAFGVSYGERGMAKILTALGLVWARNTNSWRLPR